MDNGIEVSNWNCRIDTSGRVVIPQAIRTEKELHNGDELVVSIEDGAIVMRTYDLAMQKLQDAYSDGIPDDVSLVDELFADRHAEASREERS